MIPYEKQNSKTIQALFNQIAPQYDRTNFVLSFGIHKFWNKSLINKLNKPNQEASYLDLCCGTGAITYELLRQKSPPISLPNIFMLDFSAEMLNVAKVRGKKLGYPIEKLTFLHADAQKIPLPENTITCATLAYGIRNVSSPQKCLQDIYRVLKPKGQLGILELTVPSNFFLKSFHKMYLKLILPSIGKLLTSNEEAYRYLCNSINTFTPPQALKKTMEEAGFRNVKIDSLTGGIATILIGEK